VSGTDPRLDVCRWALDDAGTASARLAALAPTQVYGDIAIGIGEEVTIDATGGAVISIESLKMVGGKTEYFDGNVPSCNTSFERTSHFTIVSNPEDQVLINVGKLRNGATVKFGERNRIPLLLAPGRKVNSVGSADSFASLVGALHAKQLKMRGSVQWAEPLPCR
jgi:hypothetical protein